MANENPNPNIPRVCLCSQGRSGSSMMMRVLRAGGLIVDVQSDDFTSQKDLELLRNPYGTFESSATVFSGVFANSVKMLRPELFTTIPKDYMIIFITRDIKGITASWNQVIGTGISQGRNMATIDYVAHAIDRKSKWDSIIASNPNFLHLDYDTVCSNPQAMAQSVATYLQTPQFPKFTFNQVAAALAVDTSLYINRK